MFSNEHFAETTAVDLTMFHKDFPGASRVVFNVHYMGGDEVAK